MQVLIVRHGEAVHGSAASTDRIRWLTDHGRATTFRVGEALAELGLTYRRVYTSPLVRAVQTAEILAIAHPTFGGPVEVHEPLAIDQGTTAQALAPLDEADETDVVVLVSHMPKVQGLAAHLSGDRNFPGFRTSAACLIDVAATGGTFRWMMDPDTLKARH